MIGIYGITNTLDSKTYYGSSIDVVRRLNAHKGLLQRGKHPNIKLQNAWNKYGSKHFEFRFLEAVEETYLLQVEQAYIDKYYGDRCYNIRKVAETNKGVIVRQETRTKISNTMKSIMYKGSPAAVRHSNNMRGKVFNDHEQRKERARKIKMHVWSGFVSPDGVIYKNIEDLALFATQHNLNAQSLRRLGRGERNTYKGWKAWQT